MWPAPGSGRRQTPSLTPGQPRRTPPRRRPASSAADQRLRGGARPNSDRGGKPEYLVRMTPVVLEMVAATYVRDIDVSRGFYELLGFGEQSSGKAATSAWSALRHRDFMLLLASTRPPLEIPELPLLFYFYFDEVDAVIGTLRDGGFTVLH